MSAELRRSGRPLKEIVNDALRRGLAYRLPEARAPFRAVVRDLGKLKPGLALESASKLLEQVEGSLHR